MSDEGNTKKAPRRKAITSIDQVNGSDKPWVEKPTFHSEREIEELEDALSGKSKVAEPMIFNMGGKKQRRNILSFFKCIGRGLGWIKSNILPWWGALLAICSLAIVLIVNWEKLKDFLEKYFN